MAMQPTINVGQIKRAARKIQAKGKTQ